MKLKDFPVLSFNGGLVRNKSDYELNRNEVKNSLNLDFDERGKSIRRKGFQQFGNTIASATLASSFGCDYPYVSPPIHFVMTKANGATAYYLIETTLTTALTDGDTTAVVVATGGSFTSSGTFEVGGDIITYTSITNATTFAITESTILSGKTYPIGTSVRQWSSAVTVGLTTVDTRYGCYYAILGGLIYVQGKTGGATTPDGITFTAVTDGDEPNSLFATTYRNRIYTAATYSPHRIWYSDAGDATAWTATSYFNVESSRGERNTGLWVLNDRLWIFKPSSMFYYDEVQLKQKQINIGAYNKSAIQEINGLMYTFCPAGVFVTNGFQAQKISDPVKEYLKNFKPIFDGVTNAFQTVINAQSFKWKDKYCLYIGDITTPEVLTDVVLVYDTINKNWTVYNGFTDFQHFFSSSGFYGSGIWQNKETVFGGDNTGKYYRLFEDTIVSAAGSGVGGDVIPDNISDSVGNAISTVMETPFYDIGNPTWWKKFSYVRVLVEKGDFNISYRLDKGNYITDWFSLGNFNHPNERRRLKGEDEGYRISFKITSNTADTLSEFNGLIIEDIEAISKK